jgi:hypothetical protein
VCLESWVALYVIKPLENIYPAEAGRALDTLRRRAKDAFISEGECMPLPELSGWVQSVPLCDPQNVLSTFLPNLENIEIQRKMGRLTMKEE